MKNAKNTHQKPGAFLTSIFNLSLRNHDKEPAATTSKNQSFTSNREKTWSFHNVYWKHVILPNGRAVLIFCRPRPGQTKKNSCLNKNLAQIHVWFQITAQPNHRRNKSTSLPAQHITCAQRHQHNKAPVRQDTRPKSPAQAKHKWITSAQNHHSTTPQNHKHNTTESQQITSSNNTKPNTPAQNHQRKPPA